MKVADFLTATGEAQVIAAIRTAEAHTSGEIRVHLESGLRDEASGVSPELKAQSSKLKADLVLSRAVEVFHHLKMEQTTQRNGVLFYVAVAAKQFAIYGDEGINKTVPEGFWEEVKQVLGVHFRKGQFAEGLEAGILMAGEKLKAYFPVQEDDVNELPDEISVG
mgnify:CR=1 FL=1|jgi:hypothetical protein